VCLMTTAAGWGIRGRAAAPRRCRRCCCRRAPSPALLRSPSVGSSAPLCRRRRTPPGAGSRRTGAPGASALGREGHGKRSTPLAPHRGSSRSPRRTARSARTLSPSSFIVPRRGFPRSSSTARGRGVVRGSHTTATDWEFFAADRSIEARRCRCFDRLLPRAAGARNRRLERVEVSDQHVERDDPVSPIVSCASRSAQGEKPPWIFGFKVFTRRPASREPVYSSDEAYRDLLLPQQLRVPPRRTARRRAGRAGAELRTPVLSDTLTIADGFLAWCGILP